MLDREVEPLIQKLVLERNRNGNHSLSDAVPQRIRSVVLPDLERPLEFWNYRHSDSLSGSLSPKLPGEVPMQAHPVDNAPTRKSQDFR